MMIGREKEGAVVEAKQEDQTAAAGNSNISNSRSTSQWSAFRNPRIVRVSRTFGGKDRHSKVCTVRGLRDRRIRLSVPTAIQLYDLQDRLGVGQPSKVIDWLIDNTKDDIDSLPPLQFPPSFAAAGPPPPPHHQYMYPPPQLQTPCFFDFNSTTSSATPNENYYNSLRQWDQDDDGIRHGGGVFLNPSSYQWGHNNSNPAQPQQHHHPPQLQQQQQQPVLLGLGNSSHASSSGRHDNNALPLPSSYLALSSNNTNDNIVTSTCSHQRNDQHQLFLSPQPTMSLMPSYSPLELIMATNISHDHYDQQQQQLMNPFHLARPTPPPPPPPLPPPTITTTTTTHPHHHFPFNVVNPAAFFHLHHHDKHNGDTS